MNELLGCLLFCLTIRVVFSTVVFQRCPNVTPLPTVRSSNAVLLIGCFLLLLASSFVVVVLVLVRFCALSGRRKRRVLTAVAKEAFVCSAVDERGVFRRRSIKRRLCVWRSTKEACFDDGRYRGVCVYNDRRWRRVLTTVDKEACLTTVEKKRRSCIYVVGKP